jgi:hypothetical protein
MASRSKTGRAGETFCSSPRCYRHVAARRDLDPRDKCYIFDSDMKNDCPVATLTVAFSASGRPLPIRLPPQARVARVVRHPSLAMS